MFLWFFGLAGIILEIKSYVHVTSLREIHIIYNILLYTCVVYSRLTKFALSKYWIFIVFQWIYCVKTWYDSVYCSAKQFDGISRTF